MVWIFFLLELASLFLLSRELTRYVSRLFYALFHNQNVTVYLLSFLFLPGVILHELSHLLVASVLLVPTGEVEFFPEVRGNEVKMGSVAIGQTDPLRRFLIGVAPVFGGLAVLFIAFWYLFSGVFVLWKGALLLYVVFQIGNTMFSSKKDMEGALGFGGAVAALLFVGFFLGIRLPSSFLQFFFQQSVFRVFVQMNFFLSTGIVLDGIIVLGCYLYLRTTHR